MSAETYCRVSVLSEGTQVDLALPAAVPLTVLIPAVVELVESRCGQSEAAPIAADWQLARPGQAALTSSMTLADNAICDGDQLLLTRVTDKLSVPVFDDAFESAAQCRAPMSRSWTPQAARVVGAAAALLLAGLAALLLLRNGIVEADPSHAFAPATTGCAALAAAVIAFRVYRDTLGAVTLTVCAVVFAAVAGFTVVPGEPGVPNVLLGAAAAATISAVGMQVTGSGTTALTAMTVVAVLVSVGALGCLVTSASVPAAGAVVAVIAVGLLTLAPRLSIAAVRLPLPPITHLADVDDDVPPTRDGLAEQAIRAHATLTGLVCGLSAGGLAGAVLAMCGGEVSGLAFTMAIATALLLRARSHSDMAQTTALLAAGTCTLVTLLVAVAATHPACTVWMGIAAIAASALAIWLGFTAPFATSSPMVHRGVELVEYLVLAAVAPLACWVCGTYGVVRGLSLT